MEPINTLLEKCQLFKHVFIYGDGEVGRLIRVYLHAHGIEISGFVTTQKPLKDIVMDAPTYKIEKLNCDPFDTFIVICMHKKWESEVEEYLDELGYNNYIFVDDEVRLIAENDTLFTDLYEDVERKINVLLYHRIENLETSYSIMVTEKNFEDQLKYICDNYNLLRCDEDWNHINSKSVALTFDDGYVDFFTKAYPLLKKYNVPATVFVATGGIDNDNEFWWDELENILRQPCLPDVIKTRRESFCVAEYHARSQLILDVREAIINNSYHIRDEEIHSLKMQVNPTLCARERYRTMNAEEIRLISNDPLITIGAHTENHILCDQEDYKVQVNEIKNSKAKLEDIIDKEVNLFAYPNGNIGLDTREILDKLGFLRAFTCEHACIDKDEHVYDIPRSAVLNWDSSRLERRFRGIWQTGRIYE